MRFGPEDASTLQALFFGVDRLAVGAWRKGATDGLGRARHALARRSAAL
jgi:hypothetical protein